MLRIKCALIKNQISLMASENLTLNNKIKKIFDPMLGGRITNSPRPKSTNTPIPKSSYSRSSESGENKILRSSNTRSPIKTSLHHHSLLRARAMHRAKKIRKRRGGSREERRWPLIDSFARVESRLFLWQESAAPQQSAAVHTAWSGYKKSKIKGIHVA